MTKTKFSIPRFLIITLRLHDLTDTYIPLLYFFSKKTSQFKPSSPCINFLQIDNMVQTKESRSWFLKSWLLWNLKKLPWNTFFGISERNKKAIIRLIFKNLEKLLTEHVREEPRNRILFSPGYLELNHLSW